MIVAQTPNIAWSYITREWVNKSGIFNGAMKYCIEYELNTFIYGVIFISSFGIDWWNF